MAYGPDKFVTMIGPAGVYHGIDEVDTEEVQEA